jgi:hypothetical protein
VFQVRLQKKAYRDTQRLDFRPFDDKYIFQKLSKHDENGISRSSAELLKSESLTIQS